jgi:hypothetical protein
MIVYFCCSYIYILFTSLSYVMWLTVSFIYIPIYLYLFLNTFVCYTSVSTCLILPARATCFWNPVTQKFAVKFQRACPWSISRYPYSFFGGLRDLRVQEAGCFTTRLETELPSETVVSPCYMKRCNDKSNALPSLHVF